MVIPKSCHGAPFAMKMQLYDALAVTVTYFVDHVSRKYTIMTKSIVSIKQNNLSRKTRKQTRSCNSCFISLFLYFSRYKMQYLFLVELHILDCSFKFKHFNKFYFYDINFRLVNILQFLFKKKKQKIHTQNYVLNVKIYNILQSSFFNLYTKSGKFAIIYLIQFVCLPHNLNNNIIYNNTCITFRFYHTFFQYNSFEYHFGSVANGSKTIQLTKPIT